jgi:hypothetical protein
VQSQLDRGIYALIAPLNLVERNGVEVHPIRQKVSPKTIASAMDATLQLDTTRKRIIQTHFSINAEGLHVGRTPYGYRRAEVDGRKGHLIVFEPEACIVRKIFAWHLEGRPPLWIARKLNSINLPSPQHTEWRRRAITHKGIHGILHNVVYAVACTRPALPSPVNMPRRISILPATPETTRWFRSSIRRSN